MTDAQGRIHGDGRDRHGTSVLRRPVLALCGAVAGPLFATATLVAGATTPGYSALRHDVSSLALGESGWLHSVVFIVTGLLTLAFAVGLRSVFGCLTTWGPLLVGLWAIGLVVAGVFVTDPVPDGPPGSAVNGPVSTFGGVVHDVAAAVGFVALVAALVLFTRVFATLGRYAWAAYSAVSASITLIAVVIAGYGSERSGGLGEVDGLFQRIAGGSGMAWLTVLAGFLLVHRSITSRAVE